MTQTSLDAAAMPFGKDTRLNVREREPFNAEPPPEVLGEAFITPLELFYVRNHSTIVPNVDERTFRLNIGGLVERELKLSVDDIKRNFAAHHLTATLQCAGNRRQEMMKLKPVPGEVAWSAETISTARWTGARLRDVLTHAGIKAEAQHVALAGLDECERHGATIKFGGSIPLAKAMGDDVLLAYQMNGELLTPVHGAPLRLVVAGYIGARSIKWLNQITVQHEPSDNYFQQHAYKLFPPDVTKETVDWTQGRMLDENFVTSVITAPRNLKEFDNAVKGYALATGMNTVARVEVSFDGGATWTEAAIDTDRQAGAWVLWRLSVEAHGDIKSITVRATDSAGNTQPSEVGRVWNFKGYMNNAWHTITLESTSDD